MDIWQQILDFEPFLRLLDIQAELLGPDDVVLRLHTRQEVANHLGGLHGGAQFTLGETTALTAAVFSLGKQLDQVAVLTRGATISYLAGFSLNDWCPQVLSLARLNGLPLVL